MENLNLGWFGQKANNKEGERLRESPRGRVDWMRSVCVIAFDDGDDTGGRSRSNRPEPRG